jgi:hypothetical protein
MNKAFTSSSILMLTCSERPVNSLYTTTCMGQQMVCSVGSAACDIRRARVAVAAAPAVLQECE